MSEPANHWSEMFFTRLAVSYAVAGIVLGVMDCSLFYLLGIKMEWNGHDMRLAVGGFFTTSFALFAWCIGALIESRRRLKSLSRELLEKETLAAVGRLSAGVAHEVRNPLTVIRSSAKLIREDLKPFPQSQQAADFIVSEVDRLNRFVTSLLDYCRPITPHQEMHGIKDLVEDAVHRVKLPQDVKVETAVDRDARANLDADLFISVISNLVMNSVQALDSGGKISLSLSQGEDHWQLEVRDNGAGIPPDLQERIFDPFVTTKSNGTGLGLAMARKIMAAMRGNIFYRIDQKSSGSAKGACFVVTFPKKGN